MNYKVCADGSLVCSCDMCELRAEIVALKKERDEYRALLEQGEGRIKAMVDEKLVRELAEARAQAAAMREALVRIAAYCGAPGMLNCREVAQATLDAEVPE